MKKQRTFLTSFIISLLIFISILSIISIKNKNVDKKFDDAQYTVYTVKQFDTLWNIAEEYNQFNVSTRQYVSKIFEMNNLKTEILQINQKLLLIIPNN